MTSERFKMDNQIKKNYMIKMALVTLEKGTNLDLKMGLPKLKKLRT